MAATGLGNFHQLLKCLATQRKKTAVRVELTNLGPKGPRTCDVVLLECHGEPSYRECGRQRSPRSERYDCQSWDKWVWPYRA